MTLEDQVWNAHIFLFTAVPEWKLEQKKKTSVESIKKTNGELLVHRCPLWSHL